ncbi:MAG: chemotaxis protein CheB [Pseudoxanthomonas sp.]
MSAIDSDAPSAPRVALLARQGTAREQLRGALVSAGAQITLEEDPNALDVQALSASQPHAVLVALEPAIEEALARLDPVLGDPQVTVIYDEADLAASRVGWDAQRWARHLSAKLHGHRDVLPPGAEVELPQTPEPGHPQAPTFVEDATVELHLDRAAAQSSTLPDEHVFGTLTLVPEDDAEAQPEGAFSIDAESWTPPPVPDRLELVDDVVPGPGMHDEAPTAVVASAPSAPPSASGAPRPSAFAHLSLVEDFEVVVPVRAEPMAPPPLPPGFGSMNLELESLEDPDVAPADQDATGSRVPGAVLLFAGIGGPDAVRRVLAGLPVSLELPVLVHLRLDGGRYDNLSKQIQRISPLPVLLARVGMAARAGYVYVVPDDVAADANGGTVVFTEGRTDVPAMFGALPPGKTAILLLSGADPSYAEPALMLGARGALVAGQSLQGCYDWAAAKALEHGGGNTASPEELANRVIEHLGA